MKKFRFLLLWAKWKLNRFCDWTNFARWYAQEQNEKLYKEQARRIRLQAEAATKYAQDSCAHLAGCSLLGESCSDRTSIVWHTLNSGKTIGICLVCQKQWKETDSDFLEWKSKPCFNAPSTATNKASSELENQDRIGALGTSSYTQDEMYEMVSKERQSASIYAYPSEGLDSLSDVQIKEAFEEVRRLFKEQRKAKNA